MTTDRPNLFHHASRELHQDAVLAWLASWARSASRVHDEALHATARRVVEALIREHHTTRAAKLDDMLFVQTQWNKIDVFARVRLTDGRTVAIVIENKTTSGRHGNQLARYREIAERDAHTDHVIGLYIKTGWITDSDQNLPADFALIDRQKLLNILAAPAGTRPCEHTIYREYVAYLSSVDRRYAYEQQLLHDPVKYGSAFQYDHVQWRFMRELFDQPSAGLTSERSPYDDALYEDSLYRGTNMTGAPWTQYRFLTRQLGPDRSEGLFWRLDYRDVQRGQRRPYLAVRSYENFDKSNDALRQQKVQRLAEYQRCWDEALDAINCPLKSSKTVTDRSGNYESEIGTLFIGDEWNSMQAIEQWVPVLHAELVRRLVRWRSHDPDLRTSSGEATS